MAVSTTLNWWINLATREAMCIEKNAAFVFIEYLAEYNNPNKK